jgi:hypothetical protein
VTLHLPLPDAICGLAGCNIACSSSSSIFFVNALHFKHFRVSLPGVKPVTKFANRKVATERIWKAIQTLGDGAPAEEATAGAEPQAPPAEQPVAAAEQPAVPAEEPIAELHPEAPMAP